VREPSIVPAAKDRTNRRRSGFIADALTIHSEEAVKKSLLTGLAHTPSCVRFQSFADLKVCASRFFNSFEAPGVTVQSGECSEPGKGRGVRPAVVLSYPGRMIT
jgi:hypothetical protein